MKTCKVKCWKIQAAPDLFITYPECDKGHDLIVCAICGEIYAVDVVKQLYFEPNLDIYMKNEKCIKCSNILACNWLRYPDFYLGDDGKIKRFRRSAYMPNDSESCIKEFSSIY